MLIKLTTRNLEFRIIQNRQLHFFYTLTKNYKIQYKIIIHNQISAYLHFHIQNKKNIQNSKKNSTALYCPIPTSTKILRFRNNSGFSVHQFDTYDLVSTLETTGFTHNQAVTVMRSIHALLINNLEAAKTKFISRSNLENV
ncbi:hypothetical protein PCK2_000459 [Pneumocystis canis]|nr:hypothetical protein PCK2_000459 [Pneumocystis canis]